LPHHLKFSVLRERLAVCQLAAGDPVPKWALGGGFFCVARTADELSVVCEESRVPTGVRVERDWSALKLEGPFPFSTTGVLESILQPLAQAEISIFAVSTYDTDYVLIQRERIAAAVEELRKAGHELLT
jgi:hypothetical protein